MAIHSTANSWQSFCCARLKTTIPAQSINKTSVSCEVCCYKTMKTLAWFTNITTNTKNLPHPVCSLRWLRSHLQPVLRSHWNRHTHETQSQNIIIHVWTSKDVEGSLGACVCLCVCVCVHMLYDKPLSHLYTPLPPAAMHTAAQRFF